MRKVIIIIFTLVLFMTLGGEMILKPSAAEIISNQNHICTIQLQSLSPNVSEHKAYNFSTNKISEIIYITHFFNSLKVIEGEVAIPSDGRGLLIVIEYADGSTCSFSMYPRGIRIDRNIGYDISIQDYRRFLDFIYALKTEKIILPDEVTFDPSEWAKEEVQEAIDKGLVPEWNQINYTGAITRLEVCQLIDNLLEQRGGSQAERNEIPFTDTTDSSVNNLYCCGIINGKSEQEFCPYDYITREEFAVILDRIYNLVGIKLLISEQIKNYADSSEVSDWAEKSVKRITAIGLMQGDENNVFYPKNNISKEEVIITLLNYYERILEV